MEPGHIGLRTRIFGEEIYTLWRSIAQIGSGLLHGVDRVWWDTFPHETRSGIILLPQGWHAIAFMTCAPIVQELSGLRPMQVFIAMALAYSLDMMPGQDCPTTNSIPFFRPAIKSLPERSERD